MKPKKKSLFNYDKPDEKGSEHIQMVTKDSDGWKCKKLKDSDGDDSIDNTTADEHKMLN